MTTGRRAVPARAPGDELLPLSTARYDSFVVRVCHRGGEVLHGEVTHVGSRRSRPFTDVQAVIEFIRANIGQELDAMGGQELDATGAKPPP